ncbi:MAG: hypothetical protein EOM59_04925 [Clostridia bacterium]|nr:hypothetical protein [Clostridia bacterium]
MIHENKEDENEKVAAGADKKRNYLFDNLKVWMIFVVVSTHYLRATEGFSVPTLRGATYLMFISFDMVIFLFISGYFSKNIEKCRRTAFKNFLFPYLVLMIAMYGVRYLIYGNATLNMLLPSLALWYLLVMFYYRFFLRDLVKIKYILLISFAVSIAAGLVPFLDAQLALGRAFGFLPFFLLGYYCKEEHIIKIRNLPKWSTLPLLVGLIFYSGLMAYTEALPLSTWFFKSSYASIGISNISGILIRSGLLVISLAWIVALINLLPSKRTWYSDIGMHTMSIYALHLTCRHLIQAAKTDFGGGIFSYIVPLALVALSVWIFSRPIVSNCYNGVIDSLYKVISLPFSKVKN